MKNYLITFLGCFLILISCNEKRTQEVPNEKIDSVTVVTKSETSNLDQSPLDIIYFPVNYPLLKMDGAISTPPLARVIYSRPHKKGRVIFGFSPESLCPYGKEWRLGANEATEIELFKNARIGGKLLPAGRYILYCIPYENHWKMIFNSNLYSWGLHIDKSLDIFSTDIPINKLDKIVEDFTMNFEPSAKGADLIMQWDDVQATLPIEFIN